MTATRITPQEIDSLSASFKPLLGLQFRSLSIPIPALRAFEPSQVGTIVGTLMDAMIPYLDISGVGLEKHEGILGEREGYPDYLHQTGKRVELKLLYVDNPDLGMKTPPSPREASARLTQKVTVKNVVPSSDVMLLIAYRMEPDEQNEGFASPMIIDFGVFSMIELIEARDERMIAGGGRWFGDYETPTVLSEIGRAKVQNRRRLNVASYGRKKSENKDFNEDTNFGKLKRIPHVGLKSFLKKMRLPT